MYLTCDLDFLQAFQWELDINFWAWNINITHCILSDNQPTSRKPTTKKKHSLLESKVSANWLPCHIQEWPFSHQTGREEHTRYQQQHNPESSSAYLNVTQQGHEYQFNDSIVFIVYVHSVRTTRQQIIRVATLRAIAWCAKLIVLQCMKWLSQWMWQSAGITSGCLLLHTVCLAIGYSNTGHRHSNGHMVSP